MDTTPLKFQIASTVSPEAATALAEFYDRQRESPPPHPPETLADFDKLSDEASARKRPLSDSFAVKSGIAVAPGTLGGVPVLRITPPRLEAHKPRTLIYVHGGGYVVFSAAVELVLPALMVDALQVEVVSIDYTLAPRGNYETVTDQVAAVFEALVEEGLDPARIGMFGDSAGGGIVLATTLKLRDRQARLPGALLLVSPSTDISEAGDTRMSLGAADADPILSRSSFSLLAKAYAPDGRLDHPYASPVHGDYTKPFPPTLIQGGTRELLLSDFVRLHRAMTDGGREASLDLYEGMPHVFQARFPEIPETRSAVRRAGAFFARHLSSG